MLHCVLETTTLWSKEVIDIKQQYFIHFYDCNNLIEPLCIYASLKKFKLALENSSIVQAPFCNAAFHKFKFGYNQALKFDLSVRDDGLSIKIIGCTELTFMYDNAMFDLPSHFNKP